jgi:hypothetical protein
MAAFLFSPWIQRFILFFLSELLRQDFFQGILDRGF